MKLKSIVITAILIGTTLTFTACKKDKDNNPTNPSTSPQLTLDMSLIYGLQNLILNSETYTNVSSEQFTISKFKFYISNIQLIKTDNNLVDLDDTYFLVDASDPSSAEINMQDVPAGTYKGMKFMIGVDSTRNVSGAQTGALDPANGMFWSWTAGYIFLKLEGNSPAVGNPDEFNFHIGGYMQPNNTIQMIDMNFGTYTLNIADNKNPEVHIVVDIEEFFKNPTLSLAVVNNVTTPGPAAKAIAQGYADMFSFDHIHDD